MMAMPNQYNIGSSYSFPISATHIPIPPIINVSNVTSRLLLLVALLSSNIFFSFIIFKVLVPSLITNFIAYSYCLLLRENLLNKFFHLVSPIRLLYISNIIYQIRNRQL